MRLRLRLLLPVACAAAVAITAAVAAAYPLTLTSSTNLSLPDTPAAGAVGPDARYVFLVVSGTTPRVYKIDVSGATPTVAAMASVVGGGNGWPNAAVVSPDGTYVYVGLERRIEKIRIADMASVGYWDKAGAEGTDSIDQAVIAPDGQFAYFADDGSPRRLMRIRLSDMTLDRAANLPAAGGLAISADGTALYGADNGSSSIEVQRYDAATLAAVGAPAVTDAVQTRTAVNSPDGRFMYLTNFGFNQPTQIAKVDLRTMTQVGSRLVLPTALGGWSIAISLDGTRLFTGNLNGTARVNEIRTSDMTVVETRSLSGAEGSNLQVALVSRNGTMAYFAANNPPYQLVAFTYAAAYGLTVAKAGTGSGTVTSDLGGIACGATCSADVADTSTVTLTATADAGSRFEGWSGACSGTTTCAVAMSEARAVTATFAKEATTAAAAESAAGATPAAGPVVLLPSIRRDGVAASSTGRVLLPLRCPAGAGRCRADGVLSALLPRSALARAGVRRVLARFSGVAIAAGATRTVAVRLDAGTYRALQAAGVERVRARLVTRNRPAAGGVLTARSAFWIRIAPLAPAPNVTG